MKLKAFAFFAYFLFFLFSGFLADPFLALVVATLYEMGLVGLLLICESIQVSKNPLNWAYLITGFSLIVICIAWLEILFRIAPV